MSRFRVGDECVVVRCDNVPQVVGMRCTIVTVGLPKYAEPMPGWYGVDIPFEGHPCSGLHESVLRPAPPDGGRFEPGDWALCPWRPKDCSKRQKERQT